MAPKPVSLTCLPPELRVQIFSHLLRYNGVLQRRSTIAAESLKRDETTGAMFAPELATIRAVDAAPFLISRTLCEEALDAFYELNRFKIHYNHLCTCQAQFRFAPFDSSRVRRLEIYDFHPRQGLKAVCKVCQRSGVGLVDYLATLPRLHNVVVSFDDFISITDFVNCADCEPDINLEASEVGVFYARGRQVRIQFRLPLLNQAWRNLALLANGKSLPEDKKRLPGVDIVCHALEYLQYEANEWGRVPTSLEEFLVVYHGEDRAISELRLMNEPNGARRLLAFTAALVDVLGEFFVGDCATDAIEWEYICRPEKLRWDFRHGTAL